jgi:hypothetical protein
VESLDACIARQFTFAQTRTKPDFVLTTTEI